jgi:hypothetical protein
LWPNTRRDSRDDADDPGRAASSCRTVDFENRRASFDQLAAF